MLGKIVSISIIIKYAEGWIGICLAQSFIDKLPVSKSKIWKRSKGGDIEFYQSEVTFWEEEVEIRIRNNESGVAQAPEVLTQVYSPAPGCHCRKG